MYIYVSHGIQQGYHLYLAFVKYYLAFVKYYLAFVKYYFVLSSSTVSQNYLWAQILKISQLFTD